MKIVKFTGGLGNQMFQGAFSYVLMKHNQIVKADIDLYKTRVFRGGVDLNHGGYELERLFNINFPIATDSECEKLGTRADTFFHRVSRKFFTKKTHHIEYSSEYHPELLDDKTDSYLEGYWQNPKYYENYKDEIQKLFTFKLPLNQKSQALAKEIQSEANTVAVHVRRGDYLNHPTLFVCGKKYFENALRRTFETVPNVSHFIIFSDDIPWCKENLDFQNVKATFVDWNKERESWQDMALLSFCNHAIIPNSSFSWWGAFLNCNPNKKILVPNMWNTEGFTGAICNGWETIPVGKIDE